MANRSNNLSVNEFEAPPPLAVSIWPADDSLKRSQGIIYKGQFIFGDLNHENDLDVCVAEVILPSGSYFNLVFEVSSPELILQYIWQEVCNELGRIGVSNFWGVSPICVGGEHNEHFSVVKRTKKRPYKYKPIGPIENEELRRGWKRLDLGDGEAGLAYVAREKFSLFFLPAFVSESLSDHSFWIGLRGGVATKNVDFVAGNDVLGVFWRYRASGELGACRLVGKHLLNEVGHLLNKGGVDSGEHGSFTLVTLTAYALENANPDEFDNVISIMKELGGSDPNIRLLTALLCLRRSIENNEEPDRTDARQLLNLNIAAKPWLLWALVDFAKILIDLRGAESVYSSSARDKLSEYSKWLENLELTQNIFEIVEMKTGNGELDELAKSVKKKFTEIVAAGVLVKEQAPNPMLGHNKEHPVSRIRIRLKAFDHRPLEQASGELKALASSTGSKVKGPVRLPTHIEKYTVNRSPHVNKKSREQFEMRTHKRLIDILNPTSATVNALMKLYIPSEIRIETKLKQK